ncbi:NAD(P)-binding protein [Amniculicola lignicola CBS 123094]|uniref:NAD(P)-binding protein n=1 Tax=Amniculicola lignicola CBS 123094 TaxID=1392246 RepID=A0A6A5WQL8_9PLEO|nr:NAD(P)-binding protein [Amniculicola lignicola CBS 123094]
MGNVASAFWDQTYFIEKPRFTEKDLGDQTGKVHIITGGYTGIGLELTRLLYPLNATIYIAGRSPSKAATAISTLQAAFPSSTGKLVFLQLDLSDLTTIKPAVETFLGKETRLDTLTNNAGVMVCPPEWTSAQGYDMQTATNVYGPFLLTLLLGPILARTARVAETGTVRVTWAGSFAVELLTPEGGVQFVNAQEGEGRLKGVKEGVNGEACYGQSKAANVMLGVEAGRRWGGEGILSVSFNPGNLASELDRHLGWFQILLVKTMRHPVYLGAYTELFAGWSPEITPEKNGSYIIPWGRLGLIYNRKLAAAIKPVSDGGNGNSKKLWEVCENLVRPFA